MRPILLIALLFATPLAFAEAPGDPPSSEVSQTAPLTVEEHSLTVSANAYGTTVMTQRWKVRLDDPMAAGAGFQAPTDMDGASSSGAQIFGTLATFPRDAEPGTVFTFEKRRTAKGRVSSSFRPVPDLPTDSIKVDLRGTSGTALTLWADPTAAVRFTGNSTQRASVTWEGVGNDSRHLVWSTYENWSQVSDAVAGDIDDRTTDASVLGRDLASNLTGLRPRALAERVYSAVALDDGETGTWQGARGVEEIVRSRHGNTAERGLVLINLLRLAGFDAQPALYVPADSASTAPATLPAPSLYTEPAVLVMQEGDPVVLDPANEMVVPPTLPTAVRGSLLWSAGDLPRIVGAAGIYDGRAVLSGQVVISQDGSASYSLLLTADGSAAEALRRRLGDLDSESRDEVLGRLARVSLPDLSRFQVTATGLTSTDRAIRIQMNGYIPHTLDSLGPGLIGSVHPLMAPAMAAWLPGRIEVIEELAVRRPKHVLPLSVQTNQSHHKPGATLTTTFKQAGERLILNTVASRPSSQSRPALERQAEAILHGRAGEGAQVIFFPWPGPEVTAPLRAGVEGLSPVESHMLEALAWWRAPEERKARKALKRALAIGSIADVSDAIVRFGDPENVLPWEALLDESEPADRIICVLGIEAQGRTDIAWRKAMPLSTHPDPSVQLTAKLVMARNQPVTKPGAEEDREGHTGWRDPGELLKEARALASEVGDQDASAEVLSTLAELALEAGQLEESETFIAERRAISETSHVLAMLAEVQARRGVSPGEVRQTVESAGALDPRGTLHASHALSMAGDRQGGFEWARIAARLAPKDPERWDAVTESALAVADLSAAVDGARLSSAAAPDDRERARRLRHLATLIGDRTMAQLAAKQAGEKASDIPWPANFAELTAMARPEELRAVLAFHDVETTASPQFLAIRAQLALEDGDSDSAGRDGAFLSGRFDDPRGVALSFAATAGRTYGPGALKQLSKAAETSTDARKARMEYALITGTHDALSDAKLLPDDLSAQALLAFAKSKTVEGWTGGADPALQASQFAAATLLGAASGVTARTDRARAAGVVRHIGPELLPPPLSLLYTPREKPLMIREDGVTVHRHDGGVIPLYTASSVNEGVTTLGLGFTEEAAQRALDAIH